MNNKDNTKIVSRKDPTCYFQCDKCGWLTTAPTSDVKAVGHPMCGDCDNESTEITYKEYRKAKSEQAKTEHYPR